MSFKTHVQFRKLYSTAFWALAPSADDDDVVKLAHAARREALRNVLKQLVQQHGAVRARFYTRSLARALYGLYPPPEL